MPNFSGWRSSVFIAILVGVFGGFYSFIVDVSSILPLSQNVTNNQVVLIRIALSLTLAIIFFMATIGVTKIKRYITRLFGFRDIEARWFSSNIEKRLHEGRSILTKLVSGNETKLRIVSISGTWDICRPYTEKELKELFQKQNIEIEIILAHPESLHLKNRIRKERDQDLGIMRNKIINNTHYLETVSSGRCKVRWSLQSIPFHMIANSKEIHFSPFVDGLPGHDSRRYIVDTTNPFYDSMQAWFDQTWEKALIPSQELRWVSRQAQLNRAVFLDRDDTLIKDICYFGNHQEVEIEILPGVIDGLKLLQNRGFRLIVISNQQSVGLNVNSELELALLTKRIKSEFELHDIYFDSFYYCKHTVAQSCNCRKPKPGLIEEAIRDFALNISLCHFIGDSDSDRGVGDFLPELKIHIIDNTNTFLEVAKTIAASG